MEKNFEQSKWIEHRPLVKRFNPDGVCATLVTEWLAAGGRIAKANFKRGTRAAQGWRVVTSQHTDRNTTFHENGLSPVGQPQVMRGSEGIDHVCAQPGLYYFKLCFKDGTGHALGVVSEGGKFAVFDPNQGASESLKSDLELKMKLMQLVLAYMSLDRDNWSGLEITQLRAMSLGELAFHSQFL